MHISKLGAGFLFVKAGLIHYDLVTHPFLTFSETMMPWIVLYYILLCVYRKEILEMELL